MLSVSDLKYVDQQIPISSQLTTAPINKFEARNEDKI